MNPITTKCVNGALQAGDLVISTPDDEYGCLIGRVTQINLLGTPEHDEETDNDADDIHVNFCEFDYPKKRIKEIEAVFTELYGEKKSFDDCLLDDAIMAPDGLIRITGIKEEHLERLLHSGYNAACYCYTAMRWYVDPIIPKDDEVTQQIFAIAESALTLAGFEVLDGDRNSFIIRHGASDTDFEIKLNELA